MKGKTALILCIVLLLLINIFQVQDSKGAELAPGTPVVHASPSEPEAGDTVTIDIYATINPNTQADIAYFIWWAHYGTQKPIRADDPDWVVYDRDVSAVETSSNHFEPSSPPSFEAPNKAGTITIGVLAVDAYGRPSQRGYDTVTVYAGNFRIVVTVVDMNTNDPIPFAVVQVGQPYQYTNQYGVAEVFVGSTGTYTLHVWKSNYEDAYPSVEVSGSTTYITVPLKYVGDGNDIDNTETGREDGAPTFVTPYGGTPGFELFFAFLAIVIVSVILFKRRT